MVNTHQTGALSHSVLRTLNCVLPFMIQYQLNNLFFSANQKEIIKTKAKEKQEKTQNQKSSFDLKLLM